MQTVTLLASDLIISTLSVVGKDFSESPKTSIKIETYSNAMANMFCAYLNSLH